jgi:tetratricopeptide (TPR) repeat protein/TolB-like protein
MRAWKPKKSSQSILFSLALLVMALALLACVTEQQGPVYVKDGREYGKVQGSFRHRWWNYYERGLSYAEGEYYQEAIADLTQALQQREEDQRMARTYGMHFVDYFPHRELGIIYYQEANLEVAKRELELSLSQFPSAKARFYLDRVRKALIEQQAQERTPPKLTLDFPTHEVWTRDDPVVVSGVAEDEQYIAAVAVRGRPVFLEGSAKRIAFKEKLDLPQGRQVVVVKAKNLLGMTTERQVAIHVDREGPLVTLDELQFDPAGPQQGVVVSGSVFDEAGISQLAINDREIPIPEGVEVSFTERLGITAGELVLVARDRLGNETSARIPCPQASGWHVPVMLAWADQSAGSHVLGALFGPRDTLAPTIILKGWTETQTVYLDKIYLEGQVSDQSKIESLTLNQMPILRRKGQSIFFSHLMELQKGENAINIAARDEAGNEAIKRITVTRNVPQALQLAERLSLTVLPFEQKGAVSEASLSFQDNLINALVNQDRFRVIEREKLDLVLQEQKLSRSELIDASTALRLGKLIAAHSIVTGSMIETRNGIEIVSRMIDTETSEILATEDVYDEEKDLPAMKSLAVGMALKFHRDFPLLGGLVIQCKGKNIFTDLGQDRIGLQRRLIVYREEPIKHPVSGKILGADNEILGRARVTQVLPDMSKAELIGGKPEAVKMMDKVITE